MVQRAPLRADMRDPRNERFFSRVWERFFASIPDEIEEVSNENIEIGAAIANWHAEQLETLINSIPPAPDYSHRIEALEQQFSAYPNLLAQIEELQILFASNPSLAALFTLYVLKAGDTMTGELIINPASGDNALDAQQNIKVKSGKKIIYDGI